MVNICICLLSEAEMIKKKKMPVHECAAGVMTCLALLSIKTVSRRKTGLGSVFIVNNTHNSENVMSKSFLTVKTKLQNFVSCCFHGQEWTLQNFQVINQIIYNIRHILILWFQIWCTVTDFYPYHVLSVYTWWKTRVGCSIALHCIGLSWELGCLWKKASFKVKSFHFANPSEQCYRCCQRGLFTILPAWIAPFVAVKLHWQVCN